MSVPYLIVLLPFKVLYRRICFAYVGKDLKVGIIMCISKKFRPSATLQSIYIRKCLSSYRRPF
jgi:hypothetical protein